MKYEPRRYKISYIDADLAYAAMEEFAENVSSDVTLRDAVYGDYSSVTESVYAYSLEDVQQTLDTYIRIMALAAYEVSIVEEWLVCSEDGYEYTSVRGLFDLDPRSNLFEYGNDWKAA